MKTWVVRIGVAVVLILVGYVGGHYKGTIVHAQQYTPTIPKAWGRCVGGGVPFLIFEDSAGTIRVVQANTGEVAVQANRN